MTAAAMTSPNVLGCVVPSPVGALTLLATEVGICGVYFEDRCQRSWREGDSQTLKSARAQLLEYFQCKRREFDLPLDMQGTPFQKSVWKALLTVKFGVTASYRDIAEKIGNPKAVRAVGLANGRNPVSLIVPCHRVIGANGKLTGYGGGLDRKRFLLAMESGELDEMLPLA